MFTRPNELIDRGEHRVQVVYRHVGQLACPSDVTKHTDDIAQIHLRGHANVPARCSGIKRHHVGPPLDKASRPIVVHHLVPVVLAKVAGMPVLEWYTGRASVAHHHACGTPLRVLVAQGVEHVEERCPRPLEADELRRNYVQVSYALHFRVDETARFHLEDLLFEGFRDLDCDVDDWDAGQG